MMGSASRYQHLKMSASQYWIVLMVLGYGVGAAVWIFLSDILLQWLVSDPKIIIRVSLLKGWLFVATTSLLLYLLLQIQRRKLQQSESVLHEQSERIKALGLLAAVAESSEDAIYAKDLHGRYILFNRACSVIIGKPVDEVLGHDDYALFPIEQATALMAQDRQVITAGQTVTTEETLRVERGNRVFMNTRGPLRNEAGVIIGIFGLSRDITERKQSEEILRLSEKRYRSLFENMMNGYTHCLMVYENDQPCDFIYLHVNQAYETLTGLKNVIGRSVRDVIPGIEVSNPEWFEIYGRVARHGRPEQFEIYVGPLHNWYMISVYCPEPDQFVAIFDVITERKITEDAMMRQNEEIRQRNVELERFNYATVGRELDMIALKQQVNVLSRRLGQALPYDLTFLEPSTPSSENTLIKPEDSS